MKILRHPPNAIAVTRYLRIVLVAWMFTTALFFIVPQSTSKVHAQESYIIHVVGAGDNLTTIARRYNVSVATLMAYNGISNANVIRLNQQIRVPTTTVQPAPTSRPEPTSTSVSNNAPVATRTPVPSTNREGSSPAIVTPVKYATPDSTEEAETYSQAPVPTPTSRVPSGGPSGYTTVGEPVYTVRRGDTLSGIASQYGVTVLSIMQRNGLGSSAIIVSQRLIIPINTTAPTPTSTYQAPSRAFQTPTAWPTARATVRATATTSYRAQPTPTKRTYSSFLITATPTPRLR